MVVVALPFPMLEWLQTNIALEPVMLLQSHKQHPLPWQMILITNTNTTYYNNWTAEILKQGYFCTLSRSTPVKK